MISKKFNKQLTEIFPFLLPRNVFTDELPNDYDYSYIWGVGDVPEGWEYLFLLFCKYLRKELTKYNFVNRFRFNQVKEKYGELRIYTAGVPKDSNCFDLISIFEYLSRYVCQSCGDIATYVSQGWIEQQCSKHKGKNSCEKPNMDLQLKQFRYTDGKTITRKIDCTVYWNEYVRCINMTEDEFINYVTVVD